MTIPHKLTKLQERIRALTAGIAPLTISRPDIRSDILVNPHGGLFSFTGPAGNIIDLDLDAACKLHYPGGLNSAQIAMFNALASKEYRFITACVGRRVGKTTVANLALHLVSLMPGKGLLIIAPNLNLADISWTIQTGYMRKYDVEVVRMNSADKTIELSNGSFIKVGSSNRPDSCVGRSYDLILYDEAGIAEELATGFNVALRPTLDKPNSKCIFISTPRGLNDFHTFYQRGFSTDPRFSKWCSIHATFEVNDRASLEDIEEALATMSEQHFAQEYLAQFTSFEGQVFKSFVKERDIFYLDGIDLNGCDAYIGYDVGFRDPSACVVILVDMGTGIHYIVDAWQEGNLSTADQAAKVKASMEIWDADFIYIDSAAAQMKHDFAVLYDIMCINADKSILDGVGYLTMMFEQGRLKVADHLEDFIIALTNARWDTDSQREKLKHEDSFIHYMDAFRYGVYTARHQVG